MLDSQLLAESEIFKNDVLFSPEYELEALKDELGEDFQGCLLPDVSIEFILNRYSGSLHKPLKQIKFEFLRRMGMLLHKMRFITNRILVKL